LFDEVFCIDTFDFSIWNSLILIDLCAICPSEIILKPLNDTTFKKNFNALKNMTFKKINCEKIFSRPKCELK
jgi:hypothetical protein